MFSSELRVAASRLKAKFCRPTPSSQSAVDGEFDFVDQAGTADVIGAHPLSPLPPRPTVVHRGNQDDRESGRLVREQHFDAIGIRHLDVGDYNVIERCRVSSWHLLLTHGFRPCGPRGGAISSISQIDARRRKPECYPCARPPCPPAAHCFPAWGLGCGAAGSSRISPRPQPPGAQRENKDAFAFPDFGTRPHLAFVRLHDQIHDGQAQPGAAFEL